MDSQIVHNPKRDVAASIRNRDSALWESWYRGYFASFVRAEYRPNDFDLQQAGVDTIVFLASGQRLIEEKERKTDYGDIALEYWGDYEGKRPGWIEKPSRCDFLAYAFLPSQTCYFLPFDLLQHAWYANKASWIKRYRKVRAQNEGYSSYSLAVPIGHLLAAMGLDFKGTVITRRG